jgi:hypothetical protein
MNMATRRKTWVYGPRKAPKPKVSDTVKAELSRKAQGLIDQQLKPTHIKPPPKKPSHNYLIDIFAKWHQSYFYFCSTYACPFPHAISPTFESRFARMGYLGEGQFNLSYMRHTGQWEEIYPYLSMDECLEAIRDEPHFLP